MIKQRRRRYYKLEITAKENFQQKDYHHENMPI